jgi:hypothetical protein
MSLMFYLPSPRDSQPAGSGLDRLLARVIGLLAWGALALIGLVFALSLLIWLVIALLASLIASVFTGKPAAVTVLWRRYRDLTRQRWPQRPPGGNTPRADAADAAAPTHTVEDVAWRDVPRQGGNDPGSRHPGISPSPAKRGKAGMGASGASTWRCACSTAAAPIPAFPRERGKEPGPASFNIFCLHRRTRR